MADVIDLASRRPVAVGSGAREALIEVAFTLPNDTSVDEAEMWSDWVLMELWSRGFKVVAVEK